MIRLSEILRSEVVTESGERLGHAFDVRVRRRPGSATDRADQQWRVTGIVVGRRGLRERLGSGGLGEAGPRLSEEIVPWEDVIRIEPGRIVVREGAEAQ
jgi:sporulation protein YlmC with PRC-barrel domain